MPEFVAFKFYRPDGTTFIRAVRADNISLEVATVARIEGAIDAHEIQPSKGDIAARKIGTILFWCVFIVGLMAIFRWLSS